MHCCWRLYIRLFLGLGEGLDDAELLLWALQCVVDFPAALSALVDDEFGTFETGIVVPRFGSVRCGAVRCRVMWSGAV